MSLRRKLKKAALGCLIIGVLFPLGLKFWKGDGDIPDIWHIVTAPVPMHRKMLPLFWYGLMPILLWPILAILGLATLWLRAHPQPKALRRSA